MKKQSDFYKLIEELCKEKNIKMRTSSFDYITELEKDGIKRHMVGNSLELNSASSFKIASDKYATFSVLEQNNIPTIKYNMVFNPQTRSAFENDDISKAEMWFEEYGNKVIVKANSSSQGKDVFCISDKVELKEKILELFEENNDTISICPFYDIDFEYRVIMLDNECLYCYKKQKPFVKGDGKSSLRELISKLDILDVYDNLNLDYIPDNGEKIEISWKHNLAQGAIPSVEIENDKKIIIEEIAKNAAKSIGIRFASVDIAETKDKELLVMEINSNVCMNKFSKMVKDGYKIEKEIFSKAIDKMFLY